jgi:hypothetical protein
MSADNWTHCPQCRADAMRAKRSLEAEAKATYGKKSPEEYESLRAAASMTLHVEPEFREDYEIGVDSDGLFTVDYSGRCQSCGFRYAFKHSEKLKVTK